MYSTDRYRTNKLHQKLNVLTFLKKQKELLDQKFFLTLEKDFQIKKAYQHFIHWDDMNWEEINVSIQKESEVLKTSCMQQDWEEYFLLMKSKADKLSRDIELTQSEINELK